MRWSPWLRGWRSEQHSGPSLPTENMSSYYGNQWASKYVITRNVIRDHFGNLNVIKDQPCHVVVVDLLDRSRVLHCCKPSSGSIIKNILNPENLFILLKWPLWKWWLWWLGCKWSKPCQYPGLKTSLKPRVEGHREWSCSPFWWLGHYRKKKSLLQISDL